MWQLPIYPSSHCHMLKVSSPITLTWPVPNSSSRTFSQLGLHSCSLCHSWPWCQSLESSASGQTRFNTRLKDSASTELVCQERWSSKIAATLSWNLHRSRLSGPCSSGSLQPSLRSTTPFCPCIRLKKYNSIKYTVSVCRGQFRDWLASSAASICQSHSDTSCAVASPKSTVLTWKKLCIPTLDTMRHSTCSSLDTSRKE